jgi:hypothetical protein
MLDKSEHLPPFWQRLEDPYGITWRVYNAIKRVDLRRSFRFLNGYRKGVRYRRPVFILGAPRSGTSLLFHLLRSSPDLGSLPGEGHNVWRAFHHPRRSGWQSDAIGPGAVRFGERRFVNAYFYSYVDTDRFVEKTPENCLRVSYLLELFPDAQFIVIKRNPCDVISSLINGWRHSGGKYRSYFVPEDLHIPGYTPRRQWCFVLIDGWRNFRASPIQHIALAQWEQCVRGVEAGRAVVPPSRWTEIFFDDLLAAPREALATICEAIGIEADGTLTSRLQELLANPVNALSAPGTNKWRHENQKELAEILPQIASLASASGFSVDPESGEYRVLS